MRLICWIAAIFSAIPPVHVEGAVGTLTFSGAVVNACSIQVQDDGLMVPDGDFTHLRSWLPGGAGALAEIGVTGGIFNIFLQKPTQFDNAPASAANAIFSSTYSLMGATQATNVDSSVSTPVNPGTTTMRVHASAWLPNNAVFEPGEYRATATVTCQ